MAAPMNEIPLSFRQHDRWFDHSSQRILGHYPKISEFFVFSDYLKDQLMGQVFRSVSGTEQALQEPFTMRFQILAV